MKKKNILFVDQGLAFGGSFIVAARLATHLNEASYSTTIITATPLADIEHHTAKRVRLIYLRKWVTYKDRALFMEKLNGLIGNSGALRVIRKGIIYGYSAVETLGNIPYFIGICYHILKHNIHIVHGNNALEAITAARLLGRKIVWHIHGDGNYSASEVNRYFKYVDKFISISQYSATNALHSGVEPNKIITIHNPTGDAPVIISDSKRSELKKNHNISEGNVVVGIFGRLVNWKGQLEFLKAANQLINKNNAIHCLIVGDDGEGLGAYTQVLKEFVVANALHNYVTFVGYVKNTDDYYQLCDIVVHASVLPEPFGLVIIEAMKNGAAVIAANTGAAPELVEHGKNGLIADPHNTSELADAIAYLIAYPEVRAAYIQSAKANVDLHMNPTSYARQVELLYSRLRSGIDN